MSLRPTFSNAVSTKVMKQYDESAVVQLVALFSMLTVEGCFETELCRHLTNHIFCSP